MNNDKGTLAGGAGQHLGECLAAVEADLALLAGGKAVAAAMVGRVAALAAAVEAEGPGEAQATARSLVAYLGSLEGEAAGDADRRQLAFLAGNLKSLLAPQGDFTPPSQALIAPIAPSREAGSNRVAVYVDSRAIAALLNEALSQAGFAPWRIGAMAELAALPEGDRPAAVVADLACCKRDPDTRRIIERMREATATPPHLFCLAAADDVEARLEAVRLGATRFFKKPLDIERLLAVLKGVTARSPAEPFRALLVDDDRSLNEYHAAVLAEAGVETRCCNQPLAAPAMVEEFQPDVIVTDVYMPGCNGLELAALLRQDGTLADTPILFLSSEPNIRRQMSALDLGADDFLTKPIAPEVLQAAVVARAKRARTLRRSRLEYRRAAELAERASRAKSEFLSSMSHELRTPLSIMMSFAQLLDMGGPSPLPEGQQKAVQEILGAGRHLLELITDVLDLARIEADRIDLSLQAVALAPLFKELKAQVAPMMAARQLAFRAGGDLEATACADVGRLRQVLYNLLSNAAKYNREGGSVTLSCRRLDGRVRITVADTGLGIPAERAGDVFQPFNRLGAERTAVEGTGIGLTVCKKLVESMDGRIGFDSVAGSGTVFWMELPAADPGAAGDAGKPPEPAGGRGRAPVRIVYVEDNPGNANLMTHILWHLPRARLEVAESAEAGLEVIRRNPPDLVLMDVHLPGMNGIEALWSLKADPRTADIPVIAVSAAAMKDDVEAGLKAGFLAYVTKPINIREFLALVRSVVG